MPPPATTATWTRFLLGRTSPAFAAFVAVAAKIPGGRGAALGVATASLYAALQPLACVAILTAKGVDAYFVAVASAATSVARQLGSLVAAPYTLDTPLPPRPCPHSACVAVTITLHALALGAATLAVTPVLRSRRRSWAWAGICLHLLWSALDLTLVARAPCPPLELHPLAHHQDARLAGGSLATVLVQRV